MFLDLFEADRATIGAMAAGGGMPIHSHSGVATVTVFTEGHMRYDDPAIGSGSIAYGGSASFSALAEARNFLRHREGKLGLLKLDHAAAAESGSSYSSAPASRPGSRRKAHVLLLARVAEALRVFAVQTCATRTLKKRGPLTALLLAYNLFGDSFFEASCRLGGKPTGRFL